MKIVLATKSRARIDILKNAGIDFSFKAANINEDLPKNELLSHTAPATQLAFLLAELKAHEVSKTSPNALVIGADQVLTCRNRWFSKAKTIEEARENLKFLRGKTHYLVNGLVVVKDNRLIWHHINKVKLTMRHFSDEFMEEYLATEKDIYNCVGGYKIEGLGAQLFRKIEGDVFSIMGLPLMPLLELLRKEGAIKK